MFEVTGNDITSLGDADLRALIQRLAIAELRTKGYPLSAVTAGGNQDAADGGLDVRVECPSAIANPDFVPRRLTGFQVKKPDMPAGAIYDEMRPKGVLREVIREIANASGAYVIVSAQGSVADKPLADRRKAMRDALHDLLTASQMHTDFYDRDRVATWVNEYPGIAAWVRKRIGRPLSGWSGIADWMGDSGGPSSPYLFNDKACLIDECSRDRKPLSIKEGMVRLRTVLRTPGQCIRLVGLSGLGKTRLVQALFEEGVGDDPLDPSLAIYTDYSGETEPIARDMARDLVARNQRAILVVDNCNPATHSELAGLCASGIGKVSLITVEYDVRDDEPERTEVFRLQSASPDLVAEWLKQVFCEISQVDREKIAGFSDGNFRVARALAETLQKGETLGSLKSRELFKRIFQQRNEPDQQLLRAAEDLSLLYSIEGEDVSAEGELIRLDVIRNNGARLLFEALVEMRRRGIVQARGRFRAILPQAIANPLAADALKRIPPVDFDRFCGALTPRMLKSVSRRLGLLHDSTEAQATVARWLRVNGPLGNLIETGSEGIQIVINIAPVAPGEVLTKLEQKICDAGNGVESTDGAQWIRLIKSLGYEAHMFERAALLLARLLASEPENNNMNSARAAFGELFQLYLSGTQASPEQRRAMIKRLAISEDSALRRCASVALSELLNSSHFTATGNFDFGARSRDWGWQPRINKDAWDWFDQAIALAVELDAHLVDARRILASEVRSLWHIEACHEALERAVAAFAQERPWIEGWIALRGALRFDGKGMSEAVRVRLEQLANRLRPADLLNQARAVILNRMGGAWDYADGEDDDGEPIRSWEKADKVAQEVGRSLAENSIVRARFLVEVIGAPQAERAFECGRGLADGSHDLNAMWCEIVTCYGAVELMTRNATILGGFLYQAHQRDAKFASSALDAAMGNPDLAPIIPYLQARIGIDDEGIVRLRRAMAEGLLTSRSFSSIANGVILNAPPDQLSELLEDLGRLPDGVEMAIDILSMYFHKNREEKRNQSRRLIPVTRDLLTRIDFKRKGLLRDFGTHNVILVGLAGDDAQEAARQVCLNIRSAYENVFLPTRDLKFVLKALLDTQPFIALDEFLLPRTPDHGHHLFDVGFNSDNAIQGMDPAILEQWAELDPVARYPLLGKYVSMFINKNGDASKDCSSLFLLLLGKAPDKRLFLGDFWNRLLPRSWSGSLADILIQRRQQIVKLTNHADEQVRAWATETMPELDQWIEKERGRDRKKEESFE